MIERWRQGMPLAQSLLLSCKSWNKKMKETFNEQIKIFYRR